MWSNTKLLVIFSSLLLLLGFGFLWFGLKSPDLVDHTTVVVESTPAASESVAPVPGEKVAVTKVIDGDTFEITGGLKVRMLGIDTPETKDPRRSVGCFGKEASNKTKQLLEGKVVILQKDISEKDKYNRLLRYVYLPLEDGKWLFVNDYLVREGYANVLTFPPDVKFAEQLRKAEKEAREGKRGLWGRC